MPPTKKVTSADEQSKTGNGTSAAIAVPSQAPTSRGKKTTSSQNTNGTAASNLAGSREELVEGRSILGQASVGVSELRIAIPQGLTGQMHWSDQDLNFLNNYRHAHKLNVSPAYSSDQNQLLLTNRRGIGRQSPTAIHGKVHKQRTKTPKSTLAQAVRKDFNNRAINEMATVVDMMYSIRHKSWCLRFSSQHSTDP